MDLNICHLYPDLLNVYGDVGNILILKHRAENRGIKVNVINVSINDEFNADDYDIVFFGGGKVGIPFFQRIIYFLETPQKTRLLEFMFKSFSILVVV